MKSPAKTAKEIFLEAIESQAPEGWPVILDRACGSDGPLRRRVEVLLKAHVGDGSLLDHPVVSPVATLDQPSVERTGTQIGPYKILDRLGSGGMGEVFLAEQRRPVQRTVALKLIKRGMDSKEVIARFEAERQALAMMRHPNVASVLDAGETDDGRPYFVMDVVRGIPITEYCDGHKLNLRERLELMVTVCQAVQHAHQKGIIHRDLKPGNILVELDDVRHVPKVIDFGVAKATNQRLTERTVFTQLSQMIGTPLYMSPEQAQLTSLDVDTLLTATTLVVLALIVGTGVSLWQAFDARKARDLADRRLTAETAARKQADANLALAKESTAREQTERGLADESHRLAAANLAAALEAVDKMLTHASDPELKEMPQAETIRKRILADALAFYDQFRTASGDSPAVRYRAAMVRVELADADASSDTVDERIYAKACADIFEEATQELELLVKEFPDELQYRLGLAKALGLHAWRLMWIQQGEERYTQQRERGIALYEREREEYDRLKELDPANGEAYQLEILECDIDIGRALFLGQGRIKDAEQYANEAVTAVNQLIRDFPNVLFYRNRRIKAYSFRADVDFELEKYSEALADLGTLLDLQTDVSSIINAISPSKIAACRDRDFRAGILQLADRAVELNQGSAGSLATRANLLAELGEFERARDDFSKINEASADMHGAETHYSVYQAALIALKLDERARYRELSQNLVDSLEDTDAATTQHFAAWTAALAPNTLMDYGKAIAFAEKSVQQDPGDRQFRTGLGAIQMRAGLYEQALISLAKSSEGENTTKTSSAYTAYFRAMTQHHLNQNELARESLAEANELSDLELNDESNRPAWNRRLTIELLRKEAETLIVPTARFDELAPSPSH